MPNKDNLFFRLRGTQEVGPSSGVEEVGKNEVPSFTGSKMGIVRSSNQ
jgi:hypothetical protein